MTILRILTVSSSFFTVHCRIQNAVWTESTWSPATVLVCVWRFSKEDVEKCKQKDLLEQTMSEMIGEFPALHQTIVAERDIYLTHTLRQATRCVEAPPNAQSAYYTVQ